MNCGSGWVLFATNGPGAGGVHVWSSTNSGTDWWHPFSGCDYSTHEYLTESGVVRLDIWKGTLYH